MNLFKIILKSSTALCVLRKNRKECTPQRNTIPKDHFGNY